MGHPFRNQLVQVLDRARNAGPWPFLVLGLVDRFILVVQFGARYVSTDDAIQWAGAVDYAHGILRWPYYYGQDYGPMFEALVAAPGIWVGAPLSWSLPAISSALFLLPFWSFALYHHARGQAWPALGFALTPVLLPVEFGMMTTIPRGFVTGLAPLAILPWAQRSGGLFRGALLIGGSVGLAGYLNPNALVFALPYVMWFVLIRRPGMLGGLGLIVGLLPAIALHLAGQAWCTAHGDAIVHRLGHLGWSVDGGAMLRSLGRMNEHLQWTCPLLWGAEDVLLPGLLALSVLAFRRGDRVLAAVVLMATAGIVASLSLPKVQDGWDSVFFPLSRMFLAVPLLVAWVLGLSAPARGPRRSLVLIALAASVSAIAYKAAVVDRVGAEQVAAQTKWVSVLPFTELEQDAAELGRLCTAHDVDLIVVPIRLGTRVWAQFRAYLHPTLVPELPPTYAYGYERRHWQRTEQGQAVHRTLLVIGGAEERWSELRTLDPRIRRIGALQGDLVHLLPAEDRPTDDRMAELVEDLLSAGP